MKKMMVLCSCLWLASCGDISPMTKTEAEIGALLERQLPIARVVVSEAGKEVWVAYELNYWARARKQKWAQQADRLLAKTYPKRTFQSSNDLKFFFELEKLKGQSLSVKEKQRRFAKLTKLKQEEA